MLALAVYVIGLLTELLSKGEKQESIFAVGGIEKSLGPEEIAGPESFLLFHRGTKLVESKCKWDLDCCRGQHAA